MIGILFDFIIAGRFPARLLLWCILCLLYTSTHTANATVHHILIPCHHRIQITGCEKAYLLYRIRQMDHSQLVFQILKKITRGEFRDCGLYFRFVLNSRLSASLHHDQHYNKYNEHVKQRPEKYRSQTNSQHHGCGCLYRIVSCLLYTSTSMSLIWQRAT